MIFSLQIQDEFKGHFVINSILSKTNVRYKIQRYYDAIHQYLSWIDIVNSSVNRIFVFYNLRNWDVSKQITTNSMFKRKDRQAQELQQAVAFHISLTSIVYTIIGISIGIVASAFSMSGSFLDTFFFVNFVKSALFYFGMIIAFIIIPIIWNRMALKHDLVKLIDRLRIESPNFIQNGNH